MPHSVLAVANRFLELGMTGGTRLTPMHLQKLCYMAHGFHLAVDDERLIADPVQAWDFGPVYPHLYDALKRYGSSDVTDLICENNWAGSPAVRGEIVEESFAGNEEETISGVFATYAHFPAFQLSALTHKDGSPWSETYEPGTRNRVIPNRLIKRYFSELAAA